MTYSLVVKIFLWLVEQERTIRGVNQQVEHEKYKAALAGREFR